MKVVVLFLTSTLLTLEAAFRTGILFKPRPFLDLMWYQTRACFYLFNFTIEVSVLVLFAIVGVGRQADKRKGSTELSHGGVIHRRRETFLSEEEIFDDSLPSETPNYLDIDTSMMLVLEESLEREGWNECGEVIN